MRLTGLEFKNIPHEYSVMILSLHSILLFTERKMIDYLFFEYTRLKSSFVPVIVAPSNSKVSLMNSKISNV